MRPARNDSVKKGALEPFSTQFFSFCRALALIMGKESGNRVVKNRSKNRWGSKQGCGKELRVNIGSQNVVRSWVDICCKVLRGSGGKSASGAGLWRRRFGPVLSLRGKC